ncbi:NblA/ycf18 family protein [Chamaesiphon minutus]|uniref:Phycobilisome degradation protein nblA n=1 Tax=Chamaesiphon minutus (strain ATCC 27169 / PCC 6605) TaxID=1173020 RepID=K9UGD8_CHAP6|nr:NblA/ycf18 family protein [Chamaesiphon minutus]AFY93728.1 Phycobilisome degradation protein nblA [Chamaesiphon minutus PCC 6605]
MDIPIGLSIEQEFSLRVYKEQVDRLDLSTTQELLLEVLRQSMVKENLLRELIKNGI